MATPPYKGTILAANTNLRKDAQVVVRLSDGRMLAWMNDADDPLYKSTDGGETWSQVTGLTFTNLSSAGWMSMTVDAEDHIYALWSRSSNVSLSVLEWSGANPTIVSTFSSVGTTNSGYSHYGMGIAVVAHPDTASYPGEYLVTMCYLDGDSGGTDHLIRALRFTGSTISATGGSTAQTAISTTVYGGVTQLYLAATEPNGFVSPTPTAPVFEYLSSGSATNARRRTFTWNGTNFTLGTSVTETIVSGDVTAMARDSAHTYYARGVSGTSITVRKHAGASEAVASGTDISPGSPGFTAIPSVHLYCPEAGTVVLVAMESRGAGFKKNTYNGTSWSGWTTHLTTELPDTHLNKSGVDPLNGFFGIVAKTERGATDDIDLVVFDLFGGAPITDGVLTNTNTLPVDAFATTKLLTDTVLANPNTLAQDALSLFRIIDDGSLVDPDVLAQDALQRVRFLTDQPLDSEIQFWIDSLARLIKDGTLVDPDTLDIDSFMGDVIADPYWIWCFVRSDGGLFLAPRKSFQAFTGADVVSENFRYNSFYMTRAMQSVAAAWVAHSGSDTATLKAAIDAALATAGFKAPGGLPL